ncbi:hypothetical protein AZZ98_004278, partial [Serratia marcescens]
EVQRAHRAAVRGSGLQRAG